MGEHPSQHGTKCDPPHSKVSPLQAGGKETFKSFAETA